MARSTASPAQERRQLWTTSLIGAARWRSSERPAIMEWWLARGFGPDWTIHQDGRLPAPDIPVFPAFPATCRRAPGRQGHFTLANTKAKCPRLPGKTPRDPPHSQGNAPMGHRCCSSTVTVTCRLELISGCGRRSREGSAGPVADDGCCPGSDRGPEQAVTDGARVT